MHHSCYLKVIIQLPIQFIRRFGQRSFPPPLSSPSLFNTRNDLAVDKPPYFESNQKRTDRPRLLLAPAIFLINTPPTAGEFLIHIFQISFLIFKMPSHAELLDDLLRNHLLKDDKAVCLDQDALERMLEDIQHMRAVWNEEHMNAGVRLPKLQSAHLTFLAHMIIQLLYPRAEDQGILPPIPDLTPRD